MSNNQAQIKIRVNKGAAVGGPLALRKEHNQQPSSIIVHVGLPPETANDNDRSSHTDRKSRKKGQDSTNNKSSIVNYIELGELSNDKQSELKMNQIYGGGGRTLGSSFSNNKQTYQTSSGKNMLSNQQPYDRIVHAAVQNNKQSVGRLTNENQSNIGTNDDHCFFEDSPIQVEIFQNNNYSNKGGLSHDIPGGHMTTGGGFIGSSLSHHNNQAQYQNNVPSKSPGNNNQTPFSKSSKKKNNHVIKHNAPGVQGPQASGAAAPGQNFSGQLQHYAKTQYKMKLMNTSYNFQQQQVPQASGSIIQSTDAVSISSALGAIGLNNANGYSQSMPPHKYSMINQESNNMQMEELPIPHERHKKQGSGVINGPIHQPPPISYSNKLQPDIQYFQFSQQSVSVGLPHPLNPYSTTAVWKLSNGPSNNNAGMIVSNTAPSSALSKYNSNFPDINGNHMLQKNIVPNANHQQLPVTAPGGKRPIRGPPGIVNNIPTQQAYNRNESNLQQSFENQSSSSLLGQIAVNQIQMMLPGGSSNNSVLVPSSQQIGTVYGSNSPDLQFIKRQQLNQKIANTDMKRRERTMAINQPLNQQQQTYQMVNGKITGATTIANQINQYSPAKGQTNLIAGMHPQQITVGASGLSQKSQHMHHQMHPQQNSYNILGGSGLHPPTTNQARDLMIVSQQTNASISSGGSIPLPLKHQNGQASNQYHQQLKGAPTYQQIGYQDGDFMKSAAANQLSRR